MVLKTAFELSFMLKYEIGSLKLDKFSQNNAVVDVMKIWFRVADVPWGLKNYLTEAVSG